MQHSPLSLKNLPALEILKAEQLRRKRNRISTYYPDSGPLRRELYVKHCEFFRSGAKHTERAIIAANRIGKTEGIGAYETTLHLTGLYPEWWDGKRFPKPVKAWAAGDTSKTVREIIQTKLLGNLQELGTGMIPGDLLVHKTMKAGVADSVDTVFVRHVTGGVSTLVFKSYDQRRISFQGSEQDLIWLDEEPPEDIYAECFMRTMTTGGFVMLTFTPLQGWSTVVDMFVNEEAAREANRFCIAATWDDAPHLTPEQKEKYFKGLPPHQRDARSKGIPSMGSGLIYPVSESDILVDPFEIPKHWRRAYGLDVGWNRTAAIWAAEDPDSGTSYLYSEHYFAEKEPSENARAIKARGAWIPGVIDPAARGRSQIDGEQLIQNYMDLGLDIQAADNSRESGLYLCWELYVNNKLKIFKSLQSCIAELRRYRRDEKGHIVKENDHLMDAKRYLMVSGRDRMKAQPPEQKHETAYITQGAPSTGWMG